MNEDESLHEHKLPPVYGPPYRGEDIHRQQSACYSNVDLYLDTFSERARQNNIRSILCGEYDKGVFGKAVEPGWWTHPPDEYEKMGVVGGAKTVAIAAIAVLCGLLFLGAVVYCAIF